MDMECYMPYKLYFAYRREMERFIITYFPYEHEINPETRQLFSEYHPDNPAQPMKYMQLVDTKRFSRGNSKFEDCPYPQPLAKKNNLHDVFKSNEQFVQAGDDNTYVMPAMKRKPVTHTFATQPPPKKPSSIFEKYTAQSSSAPNLSRSANYLNFKNPSCFMSKRNDISGMGIETDPLNQFTLYPNLNDNSKNSTLPSQTPSMRGKSNVQGAASTATIPASCEHFPVNSMQAFNRVSRDLLGENETELFDFIKRREQGVIDRLKPILTSIRNDEYKKFYNMHIMDIKSFLNRDLNQNAPPSLKIFQAMFKNNVDKVCEMLKNEDIVIDLEFLKYFISIFKEEFYLYTNYDTLINKVTHNCRKENEDLYFRRVFLLGYLAKEI